MCLKIVGQHEKTDDKHLIINENCILLDFWKLHSEGSGAGSGDQEGSKRPQGR